MKRNKKGFASIEIVFGFSLFLIILLIAFIIEMYILDYKYDTAQTSLTISNLATYKDIDLKKLGKIPPVINITDADAALNTFKYHLKQNLQLGNSFIPIDNSIAIDKIKISKFIIYNVTENSIEKLTYNKKADTFTSKIINDITTNPVYTPKGLKVTETTIHSEIEIPINLLLKGILGEEKIMVVNVDTDIIQ